VDLTTLEVQQTVTLEGDPGRPTLSAEGEYLYLLEHGKPDKKPEKNINGRVQVVSVARRAHEINLEAGRRRTSGLGSCESSGGPRWRPPSRSGRNPSSYVCLPTGKASTS
jgi:hypothetical protein